MNVWCLVNVPCQLAWQRVRFPTPRLVGMADNDNRVESGITEPTLEEDEDVRRRFVDLWSLRNSSDDTGALAAAWQPVADLLDVHACAEKDRDGSPSGEPTSGEGRPARGDGPLSPGVIDVRA